MNQSPMIHAPPKKTDEVDWATPLKRYIHMTYQEDPEKYADECMTIHRLRQDMRGAGKDLTGRDLLYRYYGQLELLDLRFPVDESHIRISFTWYDAFTLKTTSQFSLAYEKASTIFNIASVLSAIAASQNRFESDGLKRASTNFQASAGMYAYINDNFLHAPSTDLSREVVKLLSQLMLTQAQECYLELSVGAKKTFALVAKLAAQAGWSYGNIVENMTDFVNKSIFDKSWLSACQIKHKYILSISQYQKALACEAERQYGECVARLNVADTLAKEASKLANSFVSSFSPSSTQTLMPDAASSLQELTKANAAMIAEKKNSATHDNDIIYNEAVPQESVLAPIDKINAVKPISIQELYNANDIKKVIGPDMFQRLIPFSVHESASLYSEEKAKIVRGETERCDLANTELETSLIDMKLPGMLEKFKSTSSTKSLDELATPTPEVCEWADRIRDEEINKIPINELRSALEDLKNKKAKQTLDEISHILDAEQRACEEMRVKYVDEWTQATSGPLTSSIRKDLRKHRENLDKAGTSDRHFTQILEQYMNDISILSSGANGDRLETAFAEALASISNDTPAVNGKRADNILDIDNIQPEESMSSKVRQIEECVGNLNKVRKERMDTLSDLKEKTHQDDISHLLILNKKTQNIEPQLFATELEKFIPYKNRITASIHHQQKLLHQLNALHKSLMEGDEARLVQSQWEQAERKRKEVVERFRKAKDTYFEVKEGFSKGLEFYDDLSESIKNLLKTARNFTDERQKERDDLVRAITDRQQQKLRDDLRHSSAMSPTEQAFRRLSLQQPSPQAHLQTSMQQQPPPQAHLQANLQHLQQQPPQQHQPILMRPPPPLPLQRQQSLPPLSQHQQPPPSLLQHQQPPPSLPLQHQQPPPSLLQHQQPPPPLPLQHQRSPPPLSQHHHQPPPLPPQHQQSPPPLSQHHHQQPPLSLQHQQSPPPLSQHHHQIPPPPPPQHHHQPPPPPHPQHHHQPPPPHHQQQYLQHQGGQPQYQQAQPQQILHTQPQRPPSQYVQPLQQQYPQQLPQQQYPQQPPQQQYPQRPPQQQYQQPPLQQYPQQPPQQQYQQPPPPQQPPLQQPPPRPVYSFYHNPNFQ